MRPRPPGYLQFKRRYVEGDVRLGHTRSKKERKQELRGKYAVGDDGGEGEKGRGGEMSRLSPPREEQQQRDGA